MKRKVIQIAAAAAKSAAVVDHEVEYDTDEILLVLCDDGTIWTYDFRNSEWEGLPDVPQDGES